MQCQPTASQLPEGIWAFYCWNQELREVRITEECEAALSYGMVEAGAYSTTGGKNKT